MLFDFVRRSALVKMLTDSIFGKMIYIEEKI
jgi:hypothetical protein